jgi:hypothetical protein
MTETAVFPAWKDVSSKADQVMPEFLAVFNKYKVTPNEGVVIARAFYDHIIHETGYYFGPMNQDDINRIMECIKKASGKRD